MTDQKINNPRIVLIAGIILTTMTLMASLVTFSIMQRNAEMVQGKSLQVALASRARLVETEIKAVFDATVLIANRPLLGYHLELASAIKDDIAAQNQFNRIGLSFVQEGVRSIEFYDKNGTRLTRSGIVSKPSILMMPLVNFPAHLQLIWDGQLLLRAEIEIKEDGELIGKLVTESPLPITMSSIEGARRLGETGEQAICIPFPGGLEMQCLPTALNPNIFTVPYLTPDGVPIPMVHALRGKSGFVVTKDYREKMVTAAYGPIGNSGLGMVLKVDRSEWHSLIWGQLRSVIPLTFILIITSLLLLRWRLSPLVLKLTEEISERRHAEMLKGESEAVLLSTINTALDAVIQMDQYGIITDWNDQANEIFGWPRGEAIGRILQDTIIPPKHHDRLKHLLSTNKGPVLNKRIEITALRRDGHEFPIELSVTPLTVAKKTLFSYFIRDLTEKKKSEELLMHAADELARLKEDKNKRAAELIYTNKELSFEKRSKKAQRQFLSQMSHELRTPLHAVTSLSMVLGSDTIKTSPENQKKYLTAIHDSGQHLLQLIGDILDISKLDAQARDLEEKPFTIAQLINACHSTFDLICEGKGISLNIDNQLEGESAVLGDITALKQILFNLLSNAVKFTQKGSVSLTITPHMESPSNTTLGVSFIISDTGKGIAAEAMSTLFNRFTQEDSTISRSFGGSGLGLNISRSLAKLMGGNITCTSSVGKGSTFELVVFLTPLTTSPPTHSSPNVFLLPPLKVLLVDDFALNLMVGLAVLEPKGHMITTASSGEEAVAMASKNDYDVILMDVHMPGMDGMEATRAIRSIANKQRAAVTIIALSADVEVENQASFIASGMNAALGKSALAKGFDSELQRILEIK
jgi:PAS domain S-box-containing protein|tara:strand:+ start:1511 stop:4108 length:2598 start_codon:yes stop_codon:yes gene_type:complete